MVSQTIRKRVVMVLVFLLVGFGVFFGVNYYLSLRVLTVEYQHAGNVEIYKTASLDGGNDQKAYRTVDYSGQELKIPKGDYTVHYDGDKGYESKFQDFKVEEDRTLSIKPSYSEEKMAEILKAELPALKSAISQKYQSGIDQYNIDGGKLYANGEWYGTTLDYKAKEDYFHQNADTLRIILRKTGGGWIVATDPPNIYLSKFAFPTIPEYILKDVNTL